VRRIGIVSSATVTKTEWELTPEAFDGLLAWLNPDREQAGRKYEEIRRKLITILSCRGCNCPEDLTDETMNRVTRRVPQIIDSYLGDPALYFYGVAHKVHLEWLRRNGRALVPPPVPDPVEETEQEYECLEQCMEHLTSKSRELVSEYHREEKKAKIDGRNELAERAGFKLCYCTVERNIRTLLLSDFRTYIAAIRDTTGTHNSYCNVMTRTSVCLRRKQVSG